MVAEALVLVVTATAGFHHASIPDAETALRALGRRSAAYDVVVTDRVSAISAAGLRRYRAVVFAMTSGELPIPPAGRAALVSFVRRGGGFVGVHSASDTLYSYPPYGRLVGAYFRDHPYMRGTVRVVGPPHPATRGVPPTMPLVEEMYRFRSDPVANGEQVVLRLDPASAGAPADEDLPLAWFGRQGRGRTFYTALGHHPETWRSGWFRRHVDGAIRWTLGRGGGETMVR
jgi:type 1 glutamine amidotransferase